MKILEQQGNVIIKNAQHFDLEHTFLCGQCFRWDEMLDGSFCGVANDKVIRIYKKDQDIVLYNSSLEDFNKIWRGYFDLDSDYGEYKNLLNRDQIMHRAISFGWGIRILHQDTWETLISFIISASNNIPRIKKIIDLLCQNFGKKITMDNKTYYTFPKCNDLIGVSEADLLSIRAGFRAKYIVDAVKKVTSGEINFGELKQIPLLAAKKQLQSINGVGPKVADCVLLFGCGRLGVFPVDTWIDRTMKGLYPSECVGSNICQAGQDMFGELCGLAQQYIFYYARENNLKDF